MTEDFILFSIVVWGAIFISALCSVMEAALLSVPLAYTRTLASSDNQGRFQSGTYLLQYKEDLGRPVAAILILNTVSHTIGAAVAGAMVVQLYGESSVVIFSVTFTVLMLYLSEIIPKQVGAMYAKQLAPWTIVPLRFFIFCFGPLIKVSEGLYKILGKGKDPLVSEQEILSMTEIGTEEGVLEPFEGEVIKNLVGLDQTFVKKILTPRVVVFRLPENASLESVRDEIISSNFTRIPLFPEGDEENVSRYVVQRDILRALLNGDEGMTLSEFARELKVVPELIYADKLFEQMCSSGDQIVSVVDEHGSFVGIATLEDLVEEVVGREIVDEHDFVSDLRAYARRRYAARQGKGSTS